MGRVAEHIIDRVEHHPAKVILSHMVWSLEARAYAARTISDEDFASPFDRDVFRWLASPAVLALGDDPVRIQERAEAELSRAGAAILFDALRVSEHCLERWPVERAAKLLSRRAGAARRELRTEVAA